MLYIFCALFRGTEQKMKDGEKMFQVDAAKIRALLFERGLTLKEFAQMAGVNGSTVRKATTDGETLNAKSLSALAKFFGINGEELIQKGR